MAFVNLVDTSFTTVSADSPGVTLDMRNRTTLSRSTVPVRLKVFATNVVAGDTGAVKLVDSVGAAMVTVLIAGGGSSNLDTHGAWYIADGELPATLAKYDIHGGGNTLDDLIIKDWSLYELASIGPNQGTLLASIGDFGIVADGTVV